MGRAGDVLVASLALLLLSPLLIAVAILIRLLMGRPVLFRQERPGLNGRPFQLVKFRSMANARDSAGNLLPDADRLTRFGRFLRSTSIDELPELWNVLRGDMSIVGPRPLLTEYLPLYSPEQARRHEVKPGITGWAQVNGRNDLSWEEKFRLDLWYVDNRTLLLDLKIIAMTFRTVLGRRGVAGRDEATVAKFRG